MAEDSGQERTEEASPKRLRDARERGQVARSRELNSFMMLMVSGAALLVLGGAMYRGIERSFHQGLTLKRELIFDTSAMLSTLGSAIADALLAVAPFLLVTVIVAIAAPAVVGGLNWSTQALGFKWDRLDPIKGLKRAFGPQGLMELAKGLVKFILVLAVASAYLWYLRPEILGLGRESVTQGIQHAFELLAWTFLVASSALVVVAGVDAPFQMWNFRRQLRMTRQEVRDEYKETEGKPEVKRKIREAQSEISRRRMMAKVPQADVVITNPTHFAVALKYNPKTMAAPVVVAKGADLIAGEIRRIALDAKVPIASAPPLARAVYYSTELDQPIPAGLYKAVAMVLAYVFQLRRKRWAYTGSPIVMKDLPIPDELRRDS